MSKEGFLISGDQLTIKGTAETFKDTWLPVVKNCKNFLGVEAYGARWLPKLVPGYSQIEVPIYGIHGPTGSMWESDGLFDSAKLLVLNSLMTTRDSLIQTDLKVKYVLFHSPVFKTRKDLEVCKKLAPDLEVRVENGLHSGNLAATLDKVETLLDMDVPTKPMIDWWHVCHSECDTSLQFNKTFDQAIKKISRRVEDFKRACPGISIGLHSIMRNGEGFVWDDMTGSMWRDVGNIAYGVKDITVLEGQDPKLVKNIHLTDSQQSGLRYVVEKRFWDLAKFGVIHPG
jgi:hypothetical protein